MAEINDALTDLSPVSESIVNQTDSILEDEKKDENELTLDSFNLDLEDTPEQTERTPVDSPPVKEPVKVLDTDIETNQNELKLTDFNLTTKEEKSEDEINKEILDVQQSLILKDIETEYDDIRYHPAFDQASDLDALFQQEFFDWYLNQSMQLDKGELQPLQSPLMELSLAQSTRNLAQGLIDFSAFVSPFYGGDSWWNGFGKGRREGELELPSLNTPGGALDNSVQLVVEYFAPAGAAVKGTKLYSQLLSQSDEIAKFAGKYSRGEDIGAFAVGFGTVDMALVDPSSANLAAMVKDNPKLEGPVSWFLDKLATDPDNPEWQNRFVRTIEGMGIGFSLEGALWFTKVLTNGVSKGTIAVVKPLDENLYKYMKTNMPEEITVAQSMWQTLREYNPKRWLQKFVYETADDALAIRLIQQEVDGGLPSVANLRDKDLLAEFQRIKKIDPSISDDVARAQAQINLGKSGTAGTNAWMEFKLLKNAGRVIDNFFNQGTSTWRSLDATGKYVQDFGKLDINGKGFAKSISDHIKTKTQLDDFSHYLVAQRAIKLHQRGFKGNNILKNFDIKKLKQIVKNGDSNKAFQGALKDLQSYNSRLMDFAVDSGVISRKAADKMLKANPIYVPFYRVSETVTPQGVKLSVKQGTVNNPMKNFTGSGGLIQNPYQSLLKNTAIIVEAALRNRANLTLADYLDKVLVKRKIQAEKQAKILGLKGKEKRQFINDFKTVWAEPFSAKDAVKIANIDKASLIEQLKKAGVKDIDEAMFDTVDGFMKLMYFSKKNIPVGKNQTLFMVMRDGEPKFYKVNDPMLQTAVDSFGYKSFEQQHFAMSGLNTYKRFVSQMITKDPSFAFYANPIRDSVGGSITSNTWNKIPIWDTGVGVIRALSATFGNNKTNQDLFLDYINNGGGFGTIFTQNAEQYGYQLKKYFNEKTNIPMGDVITNHKGLVGIYNDAIVAFEHGTRLREYEKAIKLGYSPREAAVMAREVSVDFSMKGASSFINGFNQTVPFFNPAIQGAYKSFRTWFGEGRFKETFIKTNMYVGTPTATLWYMNHDNPDYQAYPDYMKRQAWFIPAGKRFDNALGREVTRFVIVPKPFDLYGLYANATETMLQSGYDSFVKNGISLENASHLMTDFVKSMYHNIGHAAPPVPLPPVANLGFALFGNIDTFTGANIIPGRLEQVPAEFQFTPWTSETMNALGDATGASPILIEQIYKNIMPGLGEHFLNLGDYFVNVMTDDKYNYSTNKKISLEDLPIFDRAYEDGVPQISQYELDMFDKMDDALGDYLSEVQLGELLMADEERIENWLSQDENRERMVTRSVFYGYLLETAELNTQIRLTTQDKGLNQESKARRILKIQEKKKKLAMQYLDSLEQSKRF